MEKYVQKKKRMYTVKKKKKYKFDYKLKWWKFLKRLVMKALNETLIITLKKFI